MDLWIQVLTAAQPATLPLNRPLRPDPVLSSKGTPLHAHIALQLDRNGYRTTSTE